MNTTLSMPLISFTFQNTTGYFDHFCRICIRGDKFSEFHDNMMTPYSIEVNMSTATIKFSYQTTFEIEEEVVFDLLKKHCPSSMVNDWKMLWK